MQPTASSPVRDVYLEAACSCIDLIALVALLTCHPLAVSSCSTLSQSCMLLVVRAAMLSLRNVASLVSDPANIQGQCQCCRERAELEQKYRDHIDSLSARNSELDSDDRQLRQHKYELDTKVFSAQL